MKVVVILTELVRVLLMLVVLCTKTVPLSLCSFASPNNEEDATLNIETHFGISGKLVRLTTRYWF